MQAHVGCPNSKIFEILPAEARGMVTTVIRMRLGMLPWLKHGAIPLDVSLCVAQGGHNFSLYTHSAAAVTLVIFSQHDLYAGRTTCEIPLDPNTNRTGDVWHITVPNLPSDHLYGALHATLL